MSLNRFLVAQLLAVVVWGVSSCAFAGSESIDPAKYDHPIRVACVGDSITYGMGTSEGMSYPSQLQALLGSEWVIGNFGVSGRTLLRKGDLPWWNEPAFQNAQDFNPDVVIIMLGTNDTKPHNWKHKNDFYSDYKDLIRVFEKLPSHPRIYICHPCPVPEPGHWGINETIIQDQIPLVDKLAKARKLGVIDMHAALADHPEMLPDRVHPNNDGASLMAKAAYAALVGHVQPPQVNSYFADHMVLQRDMKVPVWGSAPDGEIITVEFAGQQVSTVAKDGKWKVFLKPMSANSTPQTMTISGKGARTINDILVGDVWVASGQSNMERQLGPRGGQKEIVGWKEAVASADYPLIRQYQIPKNTSPVPLDDGLGSWMVCSPETAAEFCGVGFFFIRDVYESQKIPMAMLHTTWGGTPAEAWTSLEKLKTVPNYAQLAARIEDLANHPEKLENMRQDWFEENDAGTRHAWWGEDVTTSGWKKIDAPASFETMGIKNFDGVVWLRKAFELPSEAAGQAATLSLEMIDDSDRTWVNGKLIGETDGWNKKRNYHVPEGLLRSGRNVIAIQMLDTASGGGWAAGSGELRLEFANEAATESVSLSGIWEQQVGTPLTAGASFYVRGRLNQNSPAMLYNAMVHPLLPLPIKGVIWYQGESNNSQAQAYEDLFAAMIRDWRARWNSGEFPFLFVQIAPHNAMTPELRESQRLVLAREPNTAMTVTVDVGDANDIHPARKGPVGQRLALAARALAYGDDIEYSGPLYDSMTVTDDRAILKFTHIGSGLTVMNGELRGFEVAGSDGMFVPAKALIEGDAVVVMSDQVKSPIAVRYGWANVPDINLFNKNGLPASPFTTECQK